jgi:4'-phosphopantetheinyl transferase
MKIYYVTDIDVFNEDFIEKCVSFFPEWRKDKMLQYKHLKGRVQNGLAYLLLIKALQEEGIFNELPEFSYNEHGKPFLKNYPEWYFNISHCKTAVCCVLSKKEIGIDIEEIAAYKESLADYICNENEFAELQNSENQAEAFYRLWTMKEAVFKMLGTGITKEIKNILDTPYINVETHKIGNYFISISFFKDNETTRPQDYKL